MFSHFRALRLAHPCLLSFYSYFIIFTSVNMSDDDREASGAKWVEARSWSHVDLLEFLRPAFWALVAFMLLPRWWDNHDLTVAALNGQALYMVSLLFFYFYFIFLISLYALLFRNGSTPSLLTHTMSTSFRPGSTSFDNGMSTCSPRFLILNNDAYSDGAIGLSFPMASLTG